MPYSIKCCRLDSGEKPAPDATIKAHYIGRLLNGTEFDNSFKRGTTVYGTVFCSHQRMATSDPTNAGGSKWQIWIPSDLAYGDGGVGQAGIPGGAVLDFEIELLEIVSKQMTTDLRYPIGITSRNLSAMYKKKNGWRTSIFYLTDWKQPCTIWTKRSCKRPIAKGAGQYINSCIMLQTVILMRIAGLNWALPKTFLPFARTKKSHGPKHPM